MRPSGIVIVRIINEARNRIHSLAGDVTRRSEMLHEATTSAHTALASLANAGMVLTAVDASHRGTTILRYAAHTPA